MAAKRKAFITGITGQDGSYLAEILLEKDYEVYGMIRRSSSFNTARVDHIFGDIELVFGDLTDGSSLNQLMRTIRPDEVYNLGAQSHVRVSFDLPEYTTDVNALGTLRVLEAARRHAPRARIYLAGSSEIFGAAPARGSWDVISRTTASAFIPRSSPSVATALVGLRHRIGDRRHGWNWSPVSRTLRPEADGGAATRWVVGVTARGGRPRST